MHSWRALIAPYLRDRWEEEASWLEAHRMNFGYWESRDFSSRAAAARNKARQLTDFLATYDFAEPWNGPTNLRLAKDRVDAFVCPDNESSQSANTNYVAIVGEETAWRESRSTKLADIRDGSVRTALVVEISDSTIPWTQPADVPFSRVTFEINNGAPNHIGNRSGRGANYFFADGSVTYLETPAPDILKVIFTIDGGEIGYDDLFGF
jgi:prepilin-type processing-associated H-X9-DG protein